MLLKQFTYMHLKMAYAYVSENDIVCYAMTYCFGDIKVSHILLNFFGVSIFFYI